MSLKIKWGNAHFLFFIPSERTCPEFIEGASRGIRREFT